MSKYKFEEEIVEETKVEETTVVEESTPDSHEVFVNLLVEMGLSAEQAEAVHQMAMDLIEASEGEIEVTEEVKEEKIEEKVEASRQRRGRRRGSRTRRGLSKEGREARMLSRLRRQNIELRKQLREFGQSPATKPLRNAPFGEENEESNTTMGKATSQAFNMINKNLNK